MKVPDIDEETLSKLPEWYKVLRDICAGVENENKSRLSRVDGDQAK